MKLYYDHHAKDHPFRIGHKIWIYNPAVKPGLSKKLRCLWHGPFHLIEQITPVSFKVANLQGKLQKSSIHVNRMKQYFTYDDPPTNSPLTITLMNPHLALPRTPKHWFQTLLTLKIANQILRRLCMNSIPYLI